MKIFISTFQLRIPISSHISRHLFLLLVPRLDRFSKLPISLVPSYHKTMPALSLAAENFSQWRPHADILCSVGGGAHISGTLYHFKDSSVRSPGSCPESQIKEVVPSSPFPFSWLSLLRIRRAFQEQVRMTWMHVSSVALLEGNLLRAFGEAVFGLQSG